MPPHEPTETTRKLAETLSGLGVPQEEIARQLAISLPTLHRHYRAELDAGMAKANAVVARRLYDLTKTNASAAIFWLKIRAGWSERQQIEISGKDGGPIQVEAVQAVGNLLANLAAAKAATTEE